MSYPARIPQVIAVEVPRPHVVKVVFDDHLVRELEYHHDSSRLESVFGPLSDSKFFASVFVEHGTLAWPNGVDLDPVVLHGDAKAAGFERFRLVEEYVHRNQVTEASQLTSCTQTGGNCDQNVNDEYYDSAG